MKKYYLRYLIAFFLCLSVIPVSLFIVPNYSTVFIASSVVIVASAAFISLVAVGRIIAEIEGITQTMLKKIYLATGLVLIMVMLRFVLRLKEVGYIHISNSMDTILAGLNFAAVLVYFYVVYDLVMGVRATPKIYDASSKTSRVEGEAQNKS